MSFFYGVRGFLVFVCSVRLVGVEVFAMSDGRFGPRTWTCWDGVRFFRSKGPSLGGDGGLIEGGVREVSKVLRLSFVLIVVHSRGEGRGGSGLSI